MNLVFVVLVKNTNIAVEFYKLFNYKKNAAKIIRKKARINIILYFNKTSLTFCKNFSLPIQSPSFENMLNDFCVPIFKNLFFLSSKICSLE